MPLGPGDRLGSYEIVAPLGAGGMGEVYRARDERLGRDVAVKVLPAGFATDPERREHRDVKLGHVLLTQGETATIRERDSERMAPCGHLRRG